VFGVTDQKLGGEDHGAEGRVIVAASRHSQQLPATTINHRQTQGSIMDNLDDNLAIMLDENSDQEAYITATAAAFHDLARAYADRKEVHGRQIMVVSSASDFDNVALPLGSELQALGATVNFCCISYAWYTWEDGRHDPSWRATYRDSFLDSDFDIVVAMSVVTEPAELTTIVESAVAENLHWGRPTPLKYSSIGAIVAATVPGVRDAFETVETLPQSPQNRTWIAGTVEASIGHTGPVSPSMKRAGVVDTFKSAHVYPKSLLPHDSYGPPGRWEGNRPARPGFISGEEDMLHDLEEIDRRDAGVLTPDKRDALVNAVEQFGYSASDENDVSELSSMYDLNVEDVKRVLTEARSLGTDAGQQDGPPTPFAYAHPNGAIWRQDNHPAEMDFDNDGWFPLYRKSPTLSQMFNEDAVLSAAAEEFHLAHPMEGQAEECGRRAAIRGMMVRLGIYDKFVSKTNGAN
jgi:hypothetical protein